MRSATVSSTHVAAVFVLALCGVSPAPGAASSEPAREALPEPGSVPDEAVIAGQTVGLEVYAWRDFMPIAPPDGRPLRVRVQVVALSAGSVPGGLRIDGLWVRAGTGVWRLELQDAPPSSALEVLGTEGPKLEPGTKLDIVVRVREASGALHWLRAADVSVQRTV